MTYKLFTDKTKDELILKVVLLERVIDYLPLSTRVATLQSVFLWSCNGQFRLKLWMNTTRVKSFRLDWQSNPRAYLSILRLVCRQWFGDMWPLCIRNYPGRITDWWMNVPNIWSQLMATSWVLPSLNMKTISLGAIRNIPKCMWKLLACRRYLRDIASNVFIGSIRWSFRDSCWVWNVPR